MADTRANLRRLLSELVGDWRPITMTGGSETTAISIEMRDFAEETGAFPRWWIAMTTLAGTTGAFVPRSILRSGGYDHSIDTITVGRSFGSAVAADDVGELHEYSPVRMNRALERAAAFLFGRGIYLPIQDDSVVVDRLGANMDFETFEGSEFSNWTLSGEGATAALEPSRVLHPTSACSLTAGAAAVARQGQDLFQAINIREMAGRVLRLEGWIWATEPEAGRLAITFDGTYGGDNYFTSRRHGGAHEWEGPASMYVTARIPPEATEVTVMCEAAPGRTVVFDAVSAYIDGVHVPQYPVPPAIISSPRQVLIADSKNSHAPNYAPVTLQNPPRAGHRLRLKGRGRLSVPDAESAVVELSGEIRDALCTKAASLMFEMAAQADPLSRNEYLDQADTWARKTEELLASGIASGVVPILPRDGAWGTDRDGETNTLVLKGAAR